MESMQEMIENPAVKPGELDDFDQKLLEAAEMADRGEEIPKDLLVQEAESPEPSTDTATSEQAKLERERDPITGKFIKQTDKVAGDQSNATTEVVAPPQEPSSDQSESEYAAKIREKKEKEQVRLDKTWENVNRQKEEIEQRRQELERREQEFVRPQVQSQQRQFSSKQLFDASQEFKVTAKKALENGDYDTFNQQSDLAEKAFENAAQFYELEQKETSDMAQRRHTLTWEQNIKEAFKADPELADPDSALSKEVQSILEVQGKKLWVYPDGFNDAVAIAKMRMDAGSVSGLKETLKKLKAENDRLNGLTGITGGGVTSAPHKKKFEDLSVDDMASQLKHLAEQADGG